jgi:hypothetical protein
MQIKFPLNATVGPGRTIVWEPVQVIAKRALHHMQLIAAQTTSHTMASLDVANDRLDCLASLQPAPPSVGQRLRSLRRIN